MQKTTIYLTHKQKSFLKKRQKKTGIPESHQIRIALNMYIEYVTKNRKEK